MTILNRGQIVVYPTKTFETWAISHSEDELFFSETPEPTVYLIEEEFWDEEELLKKYAKKIVKQEFDALDDSITIYPKIETIDDFTKFFIYEIGSFVFDLLKTPIKFDKIDS